MQQQPGQWNFDKPESPGGGPRPTGIPVSVGPVPSPSVSRIFHGVRSPEPIADQTSRPRHLPSQPWGSRTYLVLEASVNPPCLRVRCARLFTLYGNKERRNGVGADYCGRKAEFGGRCATERHSYWHRGRELHRRGSATKPFPGRGISEWIAGPSGLPRGHALAGLADGGTGRGLFRERGCGS